MLGNLIGGEVGCYSIDSNAVRGRILQNRITVYFRNDEKAIKEPNESVAAVVKETKEWDGMTEESRQVVYSGQSTVADMCLAILGMEIASS